MSPPASPASPPATRSRKDPTRSAIMSSSAKGWSPLQISKRDSSASLDPSPKAMNDGPRRTSSSFKVVASNSLVSNSIFKSPQPNDAGDRIIHERRSTRNLGEMAPSARGVGSTPRGAIGLGLSPVRRSESRSPNGGAAVNGQRKVSAEKAKVTFPGVERKVSKENESPDVRHAMRVPRSSMGLKGLQTGSYVSQSPFKRPSSTTLSSSSLSQANSSETPSPKLNLPVEKDDVFSSPSPRRVSGGKQRRVSPGAAGTLGSVYRQSPTPSPRARASVSPAASSPLRRELSADIAAAFDASPTPTPHKSSMTPSRRLRGPRDALQGYDSPSKKSVTFQAIPDVKEYEVVSAEPSMDGSFDVDAGMGDEADWEDENRENSLDNLLSEQIEPSEGGHDGLTESSTADFMDTLVEEGLFSPPEMDTPAFSDQDGYELPLESSYLDLVSQTDDPDRPYLATPSLGGSVNASPLFASSHEMFPEVDEAGIPYGRTHHAERALEAHQHRLDVGRFEQPGLGRAGLAIPPTSPSFYHDYNDPFASVTPSHTTPKAKSAPAPAPVPEPHAHQTSPLPDPSLTSQTATATLNPKDEEREEREQDGVPSHKERVLAARMMATRGLGLGMPGRPTATAGPPSPQPVARAVFEEEENEVPERMLPKAPAPAPAPIGLPSPVSMSKNEIVQEPVENKDLLGAMTLPSIDKTSPFFQATSAFEQAPAPPTSESGSESASEPVSSRPTSPESGGLQITQGPPLTPPRRMMDEGKEAAESPHRLPDFDFGLGSIDFGTVGSTKKVVEPKIIREEAERVAKPEEKEKVQEKKKAPLGIPQATSTTSLNRHSMPASPASPTSHASTSPRQPKTTHDSTTNRIRQRISREMIRETIQQRLADGSLSRRPVSMGSGAELDALAKGVEKTGISDFGVEGNKDKELPAPPPESPALPSTPSKVRPKSEILSRMRTPSTPQSASKQTTTTSNPGTPTTTVERPQMRQRSQTQSAHEVFKQSEESGAEAKSALDKIVSLVRREHGGRKSSEVGKPGGAGMQREVSGTIGDVMPPAPRTPSKEAKQPAGILKNPNGLLDTAPQDAPRRVSNNVRPPSSLFSSSTSSSSSDKKEKENARDDRPTAKEQALITKRRGELGRERQVSGVSMVSQGSKKSRRSMSMGDVGEQVAQAREFRQKASSPPAAASTSNTPVSALKNGPAVKAGRGIRGGRLTLGIDDDERSILDSFREEVGNIGSDRGYKIRERPVVRASYNDKVAHSRAGDIDSGKAWKALRRPSDLHEHSAKIKEIRARELSQNPASATVFVKVLGIEGLQFPIPNGEGKKTMFCVTLDNSIDYIRTPFTELGEGARVNQEFSLVEHPNFEFSLSVDIRRDPHILKLIHDKNNPAPAISRPITSASAPKKDSHFRNLFASPRKPKGPAAMVGKAGKERASTPVKATLAPPQPAAPKKDTIANYLPEGNGNVSTIAKTHIQFKTIAKNCEARVLEIRYPMFSMFKGDPTASLSSAPSSSSDGSSRKALAKVTLQVFRLPPIPGLMPDELPQCIDDCLRGLRYHAWHEHEYFEGILTQDGGDCSHPKRRLFKILGGNLIAINEVTKKQVARIDLRQAVSITDLNTATCGSPNTVATRRGDYDEDGGFGQRPRSFEMLFQDGEAIVFMADTDKAKEGWMETLQGLIGKIPANPLWAELLTLRMREKAAKRSASSGSLAAKEARKSEVKAKR
ncbi:hypothetical protein B9479_007589 [Cryptococcus floricola]|uniref:PH domain-containing protein n=1 Tax=Cryptococcus floricola TaxID=2591691 RepID=A0A5D3AP81_9TREE|nr:hypothetical protein B9479_007589 [Cryptococcus floricola]